MEKLGLPAAIAPAEDSRLSHLTRLNALALAAARDRDGVPVAFDKDVDLNIPGRVLTAWKPVAGQRPMMRSLTLSERGAVEARAAALELALMPFEEKDHVRVESLVAAVLSGFRAMRQQGDDVAATVAVTVGVLSIFPRWAIEKACLKIARHEAGALDRRYAPNDAEMADVVREVVAPYRDKLDKATALLSGMVEPEVVTPRSGRPSYSELQERCVKGGLMIGGERPDPAKAAAEFCAATGISREEFDAIPDAPERRS